MNTSQYFAERARKLVINPGWIDERNELERLFAECQAEALNYALVELNVPSSIRDYRQRKLASEADRILRGAGIDMRIDCALPVASEPQPWDMAAATFIRHHSPQRSYLSLLICNACEQHAANVMAELEKLKKTANEISESSKRVIESLRAERDALRAELEKAKG